MAFTVRPSTVAGATYATMMVLGERTTSLEVLDDVRITLDELLYATPLDELISAELRVRTTEDSASVELSLDVAGLTVHDSVFALVDDFAITHDNGRSTASFHISW